MVRNKVLLIGFDPHSVPGVDAAMVESAIAMGDVRLRAHRLRVRVLPGDSRRG